MKGREKNMEKKSLLRKFAYAIGNSVEFGFLGYVLKACVVLLVLGQVFFFVGNEIEGISSPPSYALVAIFCSLIGGYILKSTVNNMKLGVFQDYGYEKGRADAYSDGFDKGYYEATGRYPEGSSRNEGFERHDTEN